MWIVAAAIGVVETLKDQGICRWNYTIRSVNQHAKNKIRGFAEPKILSCSSSSSYCLSKMMTISNEMRYYNKMKKSEIVLHMSCLGPTTTRFWSIQTKLWYHQS
ncbi:hypothetical protein DITRI_Ditri01bG0160000 [Diplodiscus trichospermus]